MKFEDIYSFDDFKKRKIRLEDIKEFKVESKFFDERTLFNLYRTMAKGIVSSIEFPVKEGKESIVLAGKDKNDEWIAIKVYRILHCDFKNMWKYLIADPRFFHVRKSRLQVVITWARREYKNLKIAYKAKVNCPKPIFVLENVLVMSFIGENGIPSPRLSDIKIKNPKKMYEKVVEEIEKMSKAKLIHGDLSQFNILSKDDQPFIIDFSQAIRTRHPFAKEFLERDINNINKFFKKLGVEIDENLFEKMKIVAGLE
ncbi:MAG: serine/threonine protein kinase [Candidatus Aenigmarchaeota archaeon ex4484_224]|nr:MAG: serine/threonine protein kinase [Candidatus Aenigmarchaeota archaeon ex4484_224]